MYEGTQMRLLPTIFSTLLILFSITGCSISKSDELVLMSTLKYSPTYMAFDEADDNLVLCFCDAQDNAKYRKFDIKSRQEMIFDSRTYSGIKKLKNLISFMQQFEIKEITLEKLRNKTKDNLNLDKEFQFVSMAPNSNTPFERVFRLSLRKKGAPIEQGTGSASDADIWHLDFQKQILFTDAKLLRRTDSIFPYIVVKKDLNKTEIIDSCNGKQKKILYLDTHGPKVRHQVYFPESLDKFVCRVTPDDGGLSNKAALAFFPTEQDFNDNTPLRHAEWDVVHLDVGIFLTNDIFAFTSSTWGRYSITGTQTLYLYSFEKNILIEKRVSPWLSFDSKRFELKNIAVSESGKYLAYLYDGKINIYEIRW